MKLVIKSQDSYLKENFEKKTIRKKVISKRVVVVPSAIIRRLDNNLM